MKAWRQTSPTGRTLLVAVLFTGLTTFMFLPLLAIQLTAQGIAASRTGFLVGLLAFSNQGFSLLCGMLVDRFGARRVMMAGFALRIAGYLLLGLGGGTRWAPIVAGIVTIGVGGSMLGLSIKTLLVSEDSVEPRTMLALRATFVNIGVVLGPALGAAVYPFGFPFILGACVLSHLVLGLRLVFRPLAVRTRRRPAAARDGAPEGPDWAPWQWIPLCLVGVAYWAVYSQLNVVMPITARAMTGSTAAISVVFTINGALVVLCQYTLLRHVFRRTATRTLLVVGFLAFGCAYAVLMPRAGWFSLLAFVLPVTAAEMLIGPSLDEQAIRASSTRGTGRALGTMAAAGACGSLLGASMGGFLLQTLRGGNGIWLVIIGLAVGAAAVCLLLPKDRAHHVANTASASTPKPATAPEPVQ